MYLRKKESCTVIKNLTRRFNGFDTTTKDPMQQRANTGSLTKLSSSSAKQSSIPFSLP